MEAWLVLEDGTVYEGESFGATGEKTGEVVFNTSMIGYQEILTDPSYKGQIVTMTYPLIGNYGVNLDDMESICSHVEGFVVREYQPHPSNWRSTDALDDFLTEHDVIGISGIDTRALTRRLRVDGVMRGIITTENLDRARVTAKAKTVSGMVGVDLVREVSTKQPYKWEKGHRVSITLSDTAPDQVWQTFDKAGQYRVVVMDYGAKHNILRSLAHRGCRVLVLPGDTSAELVLRLNPDGIMLSNGPGDPGAVDYAIEELKILIDQKPIFGICIGHQFLGLALGGESFKLKFGHRGANQPVQQIESGKVEITSQNHGFAIDADSLDTSIVELTHINLNDRTLEGLAHRTLPVFSVQYHPEASPGPHDADYLFDKFIDSMKLI
ncbi:MAG: glutamine-hydrolyzing carbamoyl-phosphate synthase small subunit [Candidatus Latescibacteria bacterium]|jgi:carbamoyl-phosphate synthase small subunit|nr:glutamine-hydrolyzing carbamoyl-phosphate synthase small subunit [Candidatus Latescibacterota bacterium]